MLPVSDPREMDTQHTSPDAGGVGSGAAAQLVVLRGDVQPRTVDLDRGELTLGRHERNDLVLASPKVSRFHVRFTGQDNSWFLEDQGSFNGTFINRRRVDPGCRYTLRHKDIIEVSDYQFVFLTHPDAESRERFHTIFINKTEVKADVDEFLAEYLGDS